MILTNVPEGYVRVCPTFLVQETIGRAKDFFNRVLTPFAQSDNFQLFDKSMETVRRCLPDSSCFEIESTAVLKRVVEAGREIENVAQLTTKVFPIESNFYRALFTTPKPLIHEIWREGEKVCEQILNYGGDRIAQQCYPGTFDGRLLAQVCKFTGEKIQSQEYGYAPIIGGTIGLICIYKGARAYIDGHKNYQLHAFTWSVLSAIALIAPKYLGE